MENMNNKYISVSYRLYVDNEDGKVIVEEMKEDQPFAFITGFGITLEDFEKELEKMETGEEFDFTLPKERAYGEYEEGHVIDLDKSIFSINNHFDQEHVFKGATVPLQNEDGNYFMGRVLDITDDKVKMDLNHPLAGKDLNFKGHVVENREATNDEIQSLLNHMSGGGCGCGCHDCGDDCGDGCGDDCGHCH